jgi:CheY-like chemotaxis protein
MVLEAAGYAVLAAADGDEGFRVFSQNADRIDLLLSDVVMPRAGGGELLARLRALRPGLRALFVTGHTAEGPTRDYLQEAGVRLLAKPVRSEVLLRAVRETLDAVPAGPASA